MGTRFMINTHLVLWCEAIILVWRSFIWKSSHLTFFDRKAHMLIGSWPSWEHQLPEYKITLLDRPYRRCRGTTFHHSYSWPLPYNVPCSKFPNVKQQHKECKEVYFFIDFQHIQTNQVPLWGNLLGGLICLLT